LRDGIFHKLQKTCLVFATTLTGIFDQDSLVSSGKGIVTCFSSRQSADIAVVSVSSTSRRPRVQLLLGRSLVQIAAECGERLQLAVLRHIEAQSPATCFMAFAWAAPPTRETDKPDVDGRPYAGEEKLRFQVYLAVGD
jgi:hypothetical protein